jgi:hypothetical protein
MLQAILDMAKHVELCELRCVGEIDRSCSKSSCTIVVETRAFLLNSGKMFAIWSCMNCGTRKVLEYNRLFSVGAKVGALILDPIS